MWRNSQNHAGVGPVAPLYENAAPHKDVLAVCVLPRPAWGLIPIYSTHPTLFTLILVAF